MWNWIKQAAKSFKELTHGASTAYACSDPLVANKLMPKTKWLYLPVAATGVLNVGVSLVSDHTQLMSQSNAEKVRKVINATFEFTEEFALAALFTGFTISKFSHNDSDEPSNTTLDQTILVTSLCAVALYILGRLAYLRHDYTKHKKEEALPLLQRHQHAEQHGIANTVAHTLVEPIKAATVAFTGMTFFSSMGLVDEETVMVTSLSSLAVPIAFNLAKCAFPKLEKIEKPATLAGETMVSLFFMTSLVLDIIVDSQGSRDVSNLLFVVAIAIGLLSGAARAKDMEHDKPHLFSVTENPVSRLEVNTHDESQRSIARSRWLSGCAFFSCCSGSTADASAASTRSASAEP